MRSRGEGGVGKRTLRENEADRIVAAIVESDERQKIPSVQEHQGFREILREHAERNKERFGGRGFMSEKRARNSAESKKSGKTRQHERCC